MYAEQNEISIIYFDATGSLLNRKNENNRLHL